MLINTPAYDPQTPPMQITQWETWGLLLDSPSLVNLRPRQVVRNSKVEVDHWVFNDLATEVVDKVAAKTEPY